MDPPLSGLRRPRHAVGWDRCSIVVLASSAEELFGGEFDDVRRGDGVVAVPDPRGLHPDIHDARPAQSAGAIRVRLVVDLFQPVELLTRGFVGNAVVLNGPLVTWQQTADHERES